VPDTTSGETRTCECKELIERCTHPVIKVGDPPRQMLMMQCEGWVHAGGWHRCGWPDGQYGVVARPAGKPGTPEKESTDG
jgi:hypothetical protein